MNQQPCWKAGLRQTKHMVTGLTPWSQFINICQLSHYMKDTLFRLPELIWPKPNGGRVLSDIIGRMRTPVCEAFSYGIWHISLWFNGVWPYASLNHNEICRIPYENASRTGVRIHPSKPYTLYSHNPDS